jgi:hypothetical protein
MKHLLPACLFVFIGTALAEESEWETLRTETLTIRARWIEDKTMREYWAEGFIDAPIQDIQETLSDWNNFSNFMPFMTESRQVGEVEPDGSRVFYQRIELPVVSARDNILKVSIMSLLADDFTGRFEEKWVSVGERMPARSHIVRINRTWGNWTVRLVNNRPWVVYRLASESGKFVPVFIIETASRDGIKSTFLGVEQEAQRRSRLRLKTATVVIE